VPPSSLNRVLQRSNPVPATNLTFNASSVTTAEVFCVSGSAHRSNIYVSAPSYWTDNEAIFRRRRRIIAKRMKAIDASVSKAYCLITDRPSDHLAKRTVKIRAPQGSSRRSLHQILLRQLA
jgi:hypothetical protein